MIGKNIKTEKGFTLFIALVITGTLLLVAMAIISLSVKEAFISGTARDSQYAFYAADSGLECAIYWDVVNNSSGYSAFYTPSGSQGGEQGGTTWVGQNSSEASGWYEVAYGNGTYAAVAYSGTNRAMTSTNGTSWTSRSAAGNDDQWYGIAYGNGLFVAVGDGVGGAGDRVMTSPDGVTWTARTVPASANLRWQSVVYGNGKFVAVSDTGTGNQVMTSSDGINWTSGSGVPVGTWFSVTYGNGLYVAVAWNGTTRVMTSPDGVTWTARTAPTNSGWYGVTYGNGKFVAVGADAGTGNRVMYSTDGINWSNGTSAADNNWRGVTFGNGVFVAVSSGGVNRVMTSTDGVSWTLQTTPVANAWRSVVFGGNLFVAVGDIPGDRVMTSNAGTSPLTPNTIRCNYDALINSSNQFTVGVTDVSEFTIYFLPHPYCAKVVVTKTSNTTKIESYGYNTCDTSNPRRVERAVRATY